MHRLRRSPSPCPRAGSTRRRTRPRRRWPGGDRPPRESRAAEARRDHHRDAIRHGEGLFLVVGDVHERDPNFPLQLLQEPLHLPAQLEIERPERLVEQQDLRLETSARARATRCCWPPGAHAAARSRAPTAPRARACADRARDAGAWDARSLRPKATFSKTLRCGKSAYCWKTVLTGRRWGGSSVMSPPRTRTLPELGTSRPAIIRSVVVLPQPDGRSGEELALADVSETAETAATPSKCLVSSTSSTEALLVHRGCLRPKRAHAVPNQACRPGRERERERRDQHHPRADRVQLGRDSESGHSEQKDRDSLRVPTIQEERGDDVVEREREREQRRDPDRRGRG